MQSQDFFYPASTSKLDHEILCFVNTKLQQLLDLLWFYQHWDHFGALALYRACICSSLLGGRMFQHQMVRKVAPKCVTKAEECSFTHVQSASVTIPLLCFIYTTFAHQRHWQVVKLQVIWFWVILKVFNGVHHGICLTNVQFGGMKCLKNISYVISNPYI